MKTETPSVTQPVAKTREEFYALMDTPLHPILDERLARTDVSGIVCYENLQMDSSQCGSRSAVIYGPGCAATTLEAALARHLNDLPSQRQYPVAFYVKP